MCAQMFRLFLAALIACVFTGSAHALEITIGGVKIADGGPKDIDPAQDSIRFDSTDPNPVVGFILPNRSSVSTVSGALTLKGPAGAFVKILGTPAKGKEPATKDFILSLTEFYATAQVGFGIKPLKISFQHDFTVSSQTIDAVDSIVGKFANARPAVGVFGDEVTWHGFVNCVAIKPPASAQKISSPAAPPGVAAKAINGKHGPATFSGGPPWTLKGKLKVKLGGMLNQLQLP